MPKRIEGLQGVRAVAISSAVSHSLVLAADGAVYTFGGGGLGKLGHGDESPVATPKRIEALRSVRVVAVAAGCHHSVALSASGEVYSWGVGGCGVLGHGDEVLSPSTAESNTLL